MQCETIKIKADNEQGFIIINKSDKTEKQIEFKETATKKAVSR